MKCINISLKMIDKKSKAKEHIKCMIRDGLMITRYSSITKSTQSYQKLKENHGKDGYEVAFRRGVISEWFEGKSMRLISEYALEQLKETQAELDKTRKMKYSLKMEEKEI